MGERAATTTELLRDTRTEETHHVRRRFLAKEIESELFERGRVSGVVLIGNPGDGRHVHVGLPLWAVPFLD